MPVYVHRPVYSEIVYLLSSKVCLFILLLEIYLKIYLFILFYDLFNTV